MFTNCFYTKHVQTLWMKRVSCSCLSFHLSCFVVTRLSSLYSHIDTHKPRYTHTYTRTHKYTHANTHTRARTRTHTHTYT